MATSPRENKSPIPGAPIVAVPSADPTFLTTQQLLREIASLKEIVETRLMAVEVRFASMDKAVDLLQQSANKSPTVNEVYLQHEERFKTVALQFTERDIRTDQTSRDSKVAVDAALKAQQEAFSEQNKSSALAIAKSETATTKQIDQINLIIDTKDKATNAKVDDMKERVVTIEGKGQGVANLWGVVVGVAGLVIAGIALFAKH